MVASIYDAFETDGELCAEGVWFAVSLPGGAECRFKVQPTDIDLNPAVRAAVVEYGLALAAKGEEADEEALKPKTLAVACTDWENVNGRDGKPLKCTEANKLQVFTDLPKLTSQVLRYSNNWRNFLAQRAEDIAGN